MTVFDFIVKEFPEFDAFTSSEPDWYRNEVNYGMAIRALDYAVDLKRRSKEAELERLFQHVEAGMRVEYVGDALCIDFIQRLSDLATAYEPDFVKLLGPLSKQCYEDGKVPLF